LGSSERQLGERRERFGAGVSSVGLATVLPAILGSVPAADHELAERTLIVPLVTARDVDLAEVIGAQIPGAFDFLVVDGVVLKETSLAGRSALELLGSGDVLAPPLTTVRQLESRAVSRYLAHGLVSLGAIEAHFRESARRWPGIADYLHDRLGRQTHRASMHLAMLHLPRIEDRLLALFADLGERFGRVTSDGVVIDLPLSHEIIGGLAGSRRPTVTLALKRLAASGLLERLDDQRWKLARGMVSA
jgi:CRP/FNR family transcriptional regulator, cyclic AMP receptor protein